MAEYIKREAMISKLKDPDLFNVTPRLLQIVTDIPAADVTPVVHCKDCAFSQLDGWFCGGIGTMPGHPTFLDSFCSDGMRKE